MTPDLAALPAIPRDEDGPVFRAPWEAQAFGMTLALYERGLFTWKEWADRLSVEKATDSVGNHWCWMKKPPVRWPPLGIRSD